MNYKNGSSSSVADLPPAVASYLRLFDRATRRRQFIRALGFTLFVLLIWAGFCCTLDRLFQLPAPARLVMLVCGASIGVLLLTRASWHARRLADWVAIAAQIEHRDPRFQQSLLTVVSQLAGEPAARGSDEILSHLQRQVELHVACASERPVWRESNVLLPWICCSVLIAAAAMLLRWPAVGVIQLGGRFLLPHAGIGPVTTTRIDVSPGDHDFVQSEPLQIDADVRNLRGDSAFLNLNTQGDWYRTVMNSADGVHFRYVLTSVDRDVRYYVAAGDAQSPTYLARVLRRPVVSKFQISYEFPAYVRRPPLTLINTDGLIEAPMNSRATLTIFCSEELQSALLTIGGEKILMSRTGDAASRRATLGVTRDTAYSLDLISSREVAGAGPPGTRIHPLPNQPPIARLFQAGQELRLTPRDQVSLTYQAADDYALISLGLRVKINDRPTLDLPIPLLGNHRGQQGSTRLDLAGLPLKIGDVAIVSTVAQDSAGQTTTSQPLRIEVSARPIDLDTQQRVAELEAARSFAAKLIGDFDAARMAIGQADGNPGKRSSAYAADSAQANLSLANASESATLLRQCLCRAILHTSDARHCIALAQWSDSAQTLSQAADDLFRQRGDLAAAAQPPEAMLQHSLEKAHHLADDVSTAWQSQLAAVLLAERQDMAAMKQKQSSPRLDARLQLLKIDPAAGDVAQRLQAMVDAGVGLVRAARPVDYSAAARSWAEDLSRGAHSNPGLDRRLGAAAEAEAVRPDADLQRARDLQLASRAATALAASLAGKQPEESAASASVDAFANALAAMQHEADLRQEGAARHSEEMKSASVAAASARQQLLSWAPDANPYERDVSSSARATPETVPSIARRDAEDLALQASAASAAHDYDRAARLDAALSNRLKESSPIPATVPRDPDEQLDVVQQRVAASMAAARKIENIGQALNGVAEQTRDARSPAAVDLAGRQRSVAEEISEVVTQTAESGEPNARERAAAAFLSVQEQLAAIPQGLSDARSAAAARKIAADRANSAQAAELRLGKTGSVDERGMAHRAALEAANESGEASDRLQAAMSPLDPARAAAWADELGVYAPESTSACNAIQTQLVAGLTELARALHESDAQLIDHGAGGVRAAIESVQRELAGAQDALAERDPLVAARSFAGAAADSLAQSPPDVNGAIEQQVRATGALARAWNQSIHDAASQRLSIVPSLQPVFDPTTPGEAGAWAGGTSAGGGGWGHLQPRESESMNFTGHDSDPPGYEEPLRIYFQALGKAQAANGNGH